MNDNYSLILLKPDAYKRNLVKTILDYIKQEGLEIVYSKNMYLTEDMLRGYQPLLNLPNNEGETDWQNEIIDAYTQVATDVFLLKGQNAIEKTKKIKKDLRNTYISGENKFIIYNLVHSVDDIDDLVLNVSILMPEKIALLKEENV